MAFNRSGARPPLASFPPPHPRLQPPSLTSRKLCRKAMLGCRSSITRARNMSSKACIVWQAGDMGCQMTDRFPGRPRAHGPALPPPSHLRAPAPLDLTEPQSSSNCTRTVRVGTGLFSPTNAAPEGPLPPEVHSLTSSTKETSIFQAENPREGLTKSIGQ